MPNKVFISYKNSENDMLTEDANIALELYTALTEAGIPTFYATKTLQKLGADRYKEIIDTELDQCLILIVVGTSLKNINSRWVKYEWDGFYLDILNGQKNGKVFTYVDGINPHDLPRALRSVQSFNRGKDSISSIVLFVKNALMDLEGDCEDVSPEVKDSPAGICADALEFSSYFLNSGVKAAMKLNSDQLEEEVRKLSELYQSIFHMKHYGKRVQADDIAQAIAEVIRSGGGSGQRKKLLKIKGPLGSYKNILLQYIYLLLERKEKSLLPFYVDVSVYEDSIDKYKTANAKEQMERAVDSHFAQIAKIISRYPNRKALIIIDGIRDFSSGQNRLYSHINKHLSDLRCMQIMSMDSGFTNNSHHKFSLHPLVGTDFEYYIKIVSMTVYNREMCVAFIENCLDRFNLLPTHTKEDALTIYQKLVKLNIVNLDAYWLSVLLREMMENALNEGITAPDLYEAICRKSLDTYEIDSAAKLAYQFEYGAVDFDDGDACHDPCWKVIRQHRSMLEYLIARYYVINLSRIDVEALDSIQEEMHFFNLILPKAITAFVSPIINRIEAYENKVLAIANTCYDNMTIFEKNQLVYWMGRLKSRSSIEESIILLKRYREKQRDLYRTMSNDSISKKKNAFHLRTIAVSLMVLGDKSSADEYFELLLRDKTSNIINRAFHLTYYGDTPYIPNMTMMEFDDDVCKGTFTFETLCAAVQSKLDKRVFNQLLLLELFTLCSLLQARVEAAGMNQAAVDCEQYGKKTIRFLKQIMRSRKLDEYEQLKNYFSWMHAELSQYYLDGGRHSLASVYNEYSHARKVARTGWVNRNIPNPENIVEHMYNCWLMAALYLPEESDSPDYNKQRIMNMLLIHDIGETKTGDIVRAEKNLQKQVYDRRENRAMSELVFWGTYPRIKDAAFFAEYWSTWYNEDGINYRIAREIDIIQGIYQFCMYYLEYRELIDPYDVDEWFDEMYAVKTKEGRAILDIVILQNAEFADIVQEVETED